MSEKNLDIPLSSGENREPQFLEAHEVQKLSHKEIIALIGEGKIDPDVFGFDLGVGVPFRGPAGVHLDEIDLHNDD